MRRVCSEHYIGAERLELMTSTKVSMNCWVLFAGASLKTLKFEAAYDVTCSEITGVTERLIDAIGNKYGRDLQSFCRKFMSEPGELRMCFS